MTNKKALSIFKKSIKKVAKKVGKYLQVVSEDEYLKLSKSLKLERLTKSQMTKLGGYRQLRRDLGTDKRFNDGPKVLVYDIETAPMLGYVWSMWDNNLGLNMIKHDWYVLSWSAKWLGSDESTVMYMDQRYAKDMEDDRRILEAMWELLDECDIVITQNGKKFDQKKLNARFILNGMQPPSSYRHIDTLQLAKRHFGFTSNKLAYMTDKLCTKYKKLDHAKFSGFALWKECLDGNLEAWDEMELYNRYDVLSLEELYGKLMPWDNSVDFNVYRDETDTICSCGSKNFMKNGYRRTNTGIFARLKCKKCGAETKAKFNELSKAKKKALRTRE